MYKRQTLDSTLGHLSYAINFTTGSVPKAPVYSGSNSYPSATGSPRRNPKQFYTGHVGKMAQYASGGNAIGGKTLVGELGPEQWISRDGKHHKFVGLHGMEVIDTKPCLLYTSNLFSRMRRPVLMSWSRV